MKHMPAIVMPRRVLITIAIQSRQNVGRHGRVVDVDRLLHSADA